MIKMFSIVVVIIGLLIFTPLGGEFKNRLLSKINPAITERKIIADLQQNLTTISKTINDPKFQKMSAPEQLSKLNGLVKGASTLAESAQKTATKSDITAGISTLIQKIIPSSNNTNSSTQPSSSVCPTP